MVEEEEEEEEEEVVVVVMMELVDLTFDPSSSSQP